MACNCCGPQRCKCQLETSEPNAEQPTFEKHDFSYSLIYPPWIERDYPEPFFMSTWDREFGYLGSNHIKKDGVLVYNGDISYYTRKGGIAANTAVFNEWQVPNGNGDTSGPYKTPPIPYPLESGTIFALEEKQDDVKKECQLWAKFRKYRTVLDPFGNQIVEYDPWGELELLHSTKWSEPAPAQIDVEISGDHFTGPKRVILRYYCVDPCIVWGVGNLGGAPISGTWEFTGQADWVTETTVEFPLDVCKSYGSYDGNLTYNHINCNGGPLVVDKINNKSTKIFFQASPSCGYLGNGYSYYAFNLSFFGIAGGLCEEVPLPCVNPPFEPFYCCGNVYGAYVTQPDGTVTCANINAISIYSTYFDDPYNRELIDSKTVKLNGTWNNSPTTYVENFNCETSKIDKDPNSEIKVGTILVTGV